MIFYTQTIRRYAENSQTRRQFADTQTMRDLKTPNLITFRRNERPVVNFAACRAIEDHYLIREITMYLFLNKIVAY